MSNSLAFSPTLIRLQGSAPSPFPRTVVLTLSLLLGFLIVWAVLGRLDITAVAEGKLIPATYVKVIQPADAGVVRELLVREGDMVRSDQIVARMDTTAASSELRQIQNELQLRKLQLRRIDAELNGREMDVRKDDPEELLSQVRAQHRTHRQAYLDSLSGEQAVLLKTEQDLKGAQEIQQKLADVAPIFREQEAGWNQLMKEGYAGKMMALDKQRARIENEQELKAQIHAIAGHMALIRQSKQRIAQVGSNYRQQLEAERTDMLSQRKRLEEEWLKQSHRHQLLELRAPQDGIVKELATHTTGAVVQPGTVLMTIVPAAEPLRAEVWLANDDKGFVEAGQEVQIKVAAFPFQKYGLLKGRVAQVTADATENRAPDGGTPAPGLVSRYRALVDLDSQQLETGGNRFDLASGMLVSAELRLGTRSILEYVLSPVGKAFHEAGRER
jgi:HlyD family secretion protein